MEAPMAASPTPLPRPDITGLTHRLTEIGWALFLIITGIIWLLPAEHLPPGSWLMATGSLLLALSVARSVLKVPASPPLVILGSLALLAGAFALLGLKVSLLAICIIILGGSMLLKAWHRPI
jgi:hypothetical protein